MRRAAAAATLAALATAVGASAATIPASLRLVSRTPLVVRGDGFRAHERTRLEVTGATIARRRIVATMRGSFVTRFDDVRVSRCDGVRVVAIGAQGTRAVLKILPAPACQPE